MKFAIQEPGIVKTGLYGDVFKKNIYHIRAFQ